MLNYSIIQKSQLEGALRMDAEYYQQEYFIDFSKGRWESIGNILEICQYGISQVMTEENVGHPIFRMDDIKNAFLTDEKLKYVTITNSEFSNYKLAYNDILFNRVNSEEFVGRTGVFKLQGDFVFASYLIRLRTAKDKDISPDYLNIFLNSSFGIRQIKKFMRRAVNQANVNAEELKQIRIPILSAEFQEGIKNLSNEIWIQHELSKKYYLEAEELLLKELGLKSAVFDDESSCIVNYIDIAEVNRMDAEYFQPKFQKLIEKLKSKQTNTLSAFVKAYSTGYAFKSENYQEEGIPLIRINNIRKGFIDLKDTAYLSDNDYLLSPKDVAKSGDIVISMSGTIGMSAVIPFDVAKCSINQRILRFTPKNIDSDLLALILNSIVGSFQLERIGTGGVQTNISYRDIQNILIPILPTGKQKEIAKLIRKSHEARKKSKELLEEAKRKVEEMIQKGGEIK